jgi:hypothetical protein
VWLKHCTRILLGRGVVKTPHGQRVTYVLFIYSCLLNDAISSSDYIASNCRVNNEQERIWKILYQHMPVGAEKNIKTFSQYTRCPCRNLNPGPPEREGILTTRPRRSCSSLAVTLPFDIKFYTGCPT